MMFFLKVNCYIFLFLSDGEKSRDVLIKMFVTDCKSVDLEKSLDDLSLHYGTSELGDAKLEPYQYVGQYKNHPNVNISFSNIKWISKSYIFTYNKKMYLK